MPVFAIAFPAIDPVALSLGPLQVRWYALAYIGGLLIGWWWARRLSRQTALWGAVKAPSDAALDDLIVYMALGIVLGGRIGEVLFYNLPYFLANPAESLQIWQGGMSFHGGLIGAAVAAHLFARAKGLATLSVYDLCSTVVPVGLLLGRIANFINGELWGRVTDAPWGMVFPDAGDALRHPSQLYEALLEGVVLLAVLAWAIRRWGFRRPGLIGGLFLFGYGLARFCVEFFREPEAQQGFLLGGWLTMGMLLSLPMALVGAAVFASRVGRPDAA